MYDARYRLIAIMAYVTYCDRSIESPLMDGWSLERTNVILIGWYGVELEEN